MSPTFPALATVYHYTSNNNAASILREKKIRQSKSGQHGPGTYVTPYAPDDTRHKGVSARSTECVFQFDVFESLLHKHNYGKWRILKDIDMNVTKWILLDTETQKVKASADNYSYIFYLVWHYFNQLIKYLKKYVKEFKMIPIALFVYSIHCGCHLYNGNSEEFIFGPGKYDFSTDQFVTSELFPFEDVEIRTIWPGETIEIDPTFEMDGMLTGSTSDGLVPLYKLSSYEAMASLANIQASGRMVKCVSHDMNTETNNIAHIVTPYVGCDSSNIQYIEMDDSACYCFADSTFVRRKSHVILPKTIFSHVIDFFKYVIEMGFTILIDFVALPIICLKLGFIIFGDKSRLCMIFAIPYVAWLVIYWSSFKKSIGSQIIRGIFWIIAELWSVLICFPNLLLTKAATLHLLNNIRLYGFGGFMFLWNPKPSLESVSRSNGVFIICALVSFPVFLDTLMNWSFVYFNFAISNSWMFCTVYIILYIAPIWMFTAYLHVDKIKTVLDFITLPLNHSLRPSQIYRYTATNGFSYEIDLKKKIQKNCSTLKTRKIMKTMQGDWAYFDYTWHEYPTHIQTALNNMLNNPTRFRMFMYYALHIFYGGFFGWQLSHDFSPVIMALPGYLFYAMNLAGGFVRHIYHLILLTILSFMEDFLYIMFGILSIAKLIAQTIFQTILIKYAFFSIIVVFFIVGFLVTNIPVLELVVKAAIQSFCLFNRVKNICINIAFAVFGDIVFVFRTRRKFLRLLRPSIQHHSVGALFPKTIFVQSQRA